MKSFIFDAFRLLDSVYRFFTCEKNRRVKYLLADNYEDNVCIILDKGMGDFVLFSYYLKILCDYYAGKNKVYIIADEYNIQFLRQFTYREDINIIVLKTNGIETVDGISLLGFRGLFKLAIVPQYMISPRNMEILRFISPYEIYYSGGNSSNGFFYRKYNILDYTMRKRIKSCNIPLDFYCKVQQQFVKQILGIDVKLKVLAPNKQPQYIFEDYFLVNVSASTKSHLPKFEQFVMVAECIRNNTGLLPVVIGELSSKELDYLRKHNLCSDYTNLKDMSMVVSLCQYSKYVITGDTGIYHLSLAVESKSKVIVPTWSKEDKLFYPYPYTMEKQADRVVYVKKYEDCLQCPKHGISCLYDQYKKNTVYCVRSLDMKQIVNIIEHYELPYGTL